MKLCTVSESGPGFNVSATFQQRRDSSQRLTVVVQASEDMPADMMVAFAISAANLCGARLTSEPTPDPPNTTPQRGLAPPPGGSLFQSVA
jgi:hypothetical protein